MANKKSFDEIVNAEPKVGMLFENEGIYYAVTEIINDKKIKVGEIDSENIYEQGDDGFLYMYNESLQFENEFLISKRKDNKWYKVGERNYQFCDFIKQHIIFKK